MERLKRAAARLLQGRGGGGQWGERAVSRRWGCGARALAAEPGAQGHARKVHVAALPARAGLYGLRVQVLCAQKAALQQQLVALCLELLRQLLLLCTGRLRCWGRGSSRGRCRGSRGLPAAAAASAAVAAAAGRPLLQRAPTHATLGCILCPDTKGAHNCGNAHLQFFRLAGSEGGSLSLQPCYDGQGDPFLRHFFTGKQGAR